MSPEVRVLLPSGPEDDLRELVRLLKEMLPREHAHVRRLFVHRPVAPDFFIPVTCAKLTEIARLEFEAENATRFQTASAMRPLAMEGFETSAEVIRGTPTEEVLREAGSWQADLVAVRTRSVAAGDKRIGGMASALLCQARCPVLTYHDVPKGYRLRRVLIPTDFSVSSCKSLDWGLALAEITGAEPILLHVIPRSGTGPGIDFAELSMLAAEELERWCASVNPVLPRPITEARVLEAPTAAEGILSFAGDEGADLIVMSATGSSAVRAARLGGNARKVVRGSACPVLVIPAANRVTAESLLKKGEALRRECAVEPVLAGAAR